ncbi:unnamed protein product [Rotaria magnacalcarata]|uniref:Uncharacterized protein n=1 Tax=Rotaria magnacalcarata TaxID=392030 RepID=A0A816YQU8_9BILA|nr:unnamed protein product [Rotaria magnacalcarata]
MNQYIVIPSRLVQKLNPTHENQEQKRFNNLQNELHKIINSDLDVSVKKIQYIKVLKELVEWQKSSNEPTELEIFRKSQPPPQSSAVFQTTPPNIFGGVMTTPPPTPATTNIPPPPPPPTISTIYRILPNTYFFSWCCSSI